MSFLNPLFLFALIAVAVPLLIYLLNVTKPKRIQFSTLAFFNSLKQSALRKIRIKRWLLLAVRILAVASLAVALAKPFLPAGMGLVDDVQPMVAGILVDNSPGMEQVDRNGPYIEQAVNIAREIISHKSGDDRVLLNVTNGEGLNLPLLSPAAARTETGDIEVLNAGNYMAENLRDMLRRVKEAKEPNKIIYVITDGQETQLQVLADMNIEEKFDTRIEFIRVGDATPANVGYEDVSIASGEGEIILTAILKNYGAEIASNQFLSLYVNEELIVQQPYELASDASREFRFTLPDTREPYIAVELLIEGDEMTFDNRYYAAVQLPVQRNLLVIESSEGRAGFPSYLRPMLNAAVDETGQFTVDYIRIDDISPDSFVQYDAVVLNGVRSIPDYISQPLIDHVQQGAGLLLLPASDGSISSYNRLLGFSDAGSYRDLFGRYGSFDPVDRLATPTEGHPVLEAMFDKQDEEEIRLNVPELFFYYRIDESGARNTTPILTSRTGNALLSETQVGSGRLIYSAIGADPGWSNFPIKPLFAPLFFRTVNYLVSGEGARLNNHTLGNPFRAELARGADQEAELEHNGETIMPDFRQTFSGAEIRYDGKEWEPGWVYLYTNGEKKLHAVNQNAMESNLFSLDKAGVSDIIEPLFDNYGIQYLEPDSELIAERLQSASFGIEIWHWFILLAIGLLLTESIISRHYKAESIA